MSLQFVVQTLTFGAFVGAIYGIAACGLSLVFGVLRVLNVAHGELLMLGGFVTFALFSSSGIDPFMTLPLVAVALFVLGVLLDLLLYRHVTRFDTEHKIKNSLLISFGLVLILQQVATLLWTADERTVTTMYAGQSIRLLGIVLPYTRLLNLVIGLAVIVLLHLFLHRTYFGKAIRATAEDWEAASLAGIDIRRVYLVTFALGTTLAGIAGTLVIVNYGITPTVGLSWTLKALVVVVLAGTGSIIGAFPAGILLGMAEAGSSLVIGSSYQQLVGLVIFLLVLMLRPHGLFGRA